MSIIHPNYSTVSELNKIALQSAFFYLLFHINNVLWILCFFILSYFFIKTEFTFGFRFIDALLFVWTIFFFISTDFLCYIFSIFVCTFYIFMDFYVFLYVSFFALLLLLSFIPLFVAFLYVRLINCEREEKQSITDNNGCRFGTKHKKTHNFGSRLKNAATLILYWMQIEKKGIHRTEKELKKMLKTNKKDLFLKNKPDFIKSAIFSNFCVFLSLLTLKY